MLLICRFAGLGRSELVVAAAQVLDDGVACDHLLEPEELMRAGGRKVSGVKLEHRLVSLDTEA